MDRQCLHLYLKTMMQRLVCLAGGGGRAARAASAVAMSTNLYARWLCCPQEIHVMNDNVPQIVFAAFLKFKGTCVLGKHVSNNQTFFEKSPIV